MTTFCAIKSCVLPPPTNARPLLFKVLGHGKRPVDYGRALAVQQDLVAMRANAAGSPLHPIKHPRPPPTNIPSEDLVLLLQHTPTYTAGRRIRGQYFTDEQNRLRSIAPLYATNRGGQLTYHGPGQLVGYPIINLRGSKQQLSVRCYVDRLEQILIDCMAQVPTTTGKELLAFRRSGEPGVYVGDPDNIGRQRKIASIGVHVNQFITCHGFALNCERQVEDWFRKIVVCGRSDGKVTSISSELGNDFTITVDSVLPTMIKVIGQQFKQPMVDLTLVDPELSRWIDEMAYESYGDGA